MSAINEPLSVRIGNSKRHIDNKYPLAGKKPTKRKEKQIVSEPIKLKPRPIKILETK